VPVVGDATSLQWTLKLGLGDRLPYRDERGRAFEVEIVGMVTDSILQGDLVMAEARFESLFPSEPGHRAFLVDAPPEGRDAVASKLSRALTDAGLELVPAAQRLDGFHAVQNTYLVIFQVLGGLGLLLGSVGLGSVVLRNTLERRGELALARALGFPRRAVRWWVLSEYGRLLLLGLGVGATAALVACWPTYRANSGATPPLFLVALLLAIGGNGLLWILLATGSAVRGSLVRALQAE